MRAISKSEKETYQLGKKLAAELKGGEVIGLIGDLGAGKTIFTKGLAAGLGIKQRVNSPTFVFMKIYPVNNKNIKQLVHVDAYRIKKAHELSAIGLNEYMSEPHTVTVIEWADKIKRKLPVSAILLSFENLNNNLRIIKHNHGYTGKIRNTSIKPV